jgi:hypothetical protein
VCSRLHRSALVAAVTTDLGQETTSVGNSISQSRVPPGPAFLIYFHIIACCVSLVLVSHSYEYAHIWFDESNLDNAILVVVAFSFVSILFTFAPFSFGYFVGFYLYTMSLGFLWLVCFTKFDYDYEMAGISAAASTVAFLVPALMITSPIKLFYTLSTRGLGYLLSFILAFGAATVVTTAVYNFRLIGLEDIYNFRNELQFPTALIYAVGITSNALLPFAFACFVVGKNYRRAAATLVLLLLFYPTTLSKLAFFAPLWLLFVAVLSRFVEARTTTVLTLLLPILAGIIFKGLGGDVIFGTINFRMIAVPSSALDHYNDFFSKHDLTYFCQISYLKQLIACPYTEPLSTLMGKAYKVGNFNASTIATEGVASVGLLAAPAVIFLCGLIIALGNRASSQLPARFVLMSGALFPQIFLNIPATTALLTNGGATLFLLWYVTPRTMFK